MPRLEQVTLDLPVVAFTMITALATGILFGLVPAFVSTSHAPDALREGGRHGGGRRLHRVLSALVVAEVALSLVLLAGAGLLMRSFVKLQGVDPGFRADGVLTAGVPLPASRYDTARAGNFFGDALSRLSALPGVEHVAGASCLPMPGSCIGTSFWRADLAKPADGQLTSSDIRPITPDFLKTLAIPQVAGRDFSAGDTVDSLPVAIVSEALVKEQFGNDDPLGRRLRVNIAHTNGKLDVEWTIVGVVRNIKSTLDAPDRKTIYLPFPQLAGGAMWMFVRTSQDPLSLASSVRGVVQALDTEVPVQVGTLEEVVGGTIARPRAISLLVGAFALDRARARGGRRLRGDGLLGARTNAGDWRPHGPRRHGRVGLPPRDRAGAAPRRDRRRRRARRGGLPDAAAHAPPLRRRAARPVDVRDHRAGTAARRHGRLVRAGTPRHAHGAGRGAADELEPRTTRIARATDNTDNTDNTDSTDNTDNTDKTGGGHYIRGDTTWVRSLCARA